ncbi:unnamed protein product [Meloidogyne enterolobii]|uniref:Uncharacterized protein n=1 Tax=Meloidogyne enterolobii TaxID=390850 RepID=A0ACB0XSF6_MELEN
MKENRILIFYILLFCFGQTILVSEVVQQGINDQTNLVKESKEIIKFEEKTKIKEFVKEIKILKNYGEVSVEDESDNEYVKTRAIVNGSLTNLKSFSFKEKLEKFLKFLEDYVNNKYFSDMELQKELITKKGTIKELTELVKKLNFLSKFENCEKLFDLLNKLKPSFKEEGQDKLQFTILINQLQTEIIVGQSERGFSYLEIEEFGSNYKKEIVDQMEFVRKGFTNSIESSKKSGLNDENILSNFWSKHEENFIEETIFEKKGFYLTVYN